MPRSVSSEKEVSCSTQPLQRGDVTTRSASPHLNRSDNSRRRSRSIDAIRERVRLARRRSRSKIPYFNDEIRERDRLARRRSRSKPPYFNDEIRERDRLARLYSGHHKSRSRSHGPIERSSTRHQRYESPSNSSRQRRYDSPSPSSRHRRYDSPSSSARHRRYDSPSPSTRHRRYNSPGMSSRHRRYDSPPRSSRCRRHDSPCDRHSKYRRSLSRDRHEYMSHRARSRSFTERNRRSSSREHRRNEYDSSQMYRPVPVPHPAAFAPHFAPFVHLPPPLPHYRFMRYPLYPPPMPHMYPEIRGMRPMPSFRPRM